MSMENDKIVRENEMLSKISQQFIMSLNASLEKKQQGLRGNTYSKLKEADFDNFFILAPIMIEVYDIGSEKDGALAPGLASDDSKDRRPYNAYDENNSQEPIVALNKPPFPIFGVNKFKDVYQDGIKFRFIPIETPGQNQKSPPFAIPQVAIILSSIVLCGLLVLYMNKIFIKPLNEIIQNLEKIKKGNLDVKFETQSENEEIRRTYDTLNEMVFGLIEKEKLRNNFIQNLTHDLRTPIVAQNRALAILQEELEELSGHELISGMKANNQDYLKMINLILECYKCDEASIPIDKIDLNFSNLVNSIIKALEPLSKEKNIEIVNNIKSDNLVIFGDYISINRILMNLISNAIECMDNGRIQEKTKRIEVLAQNFERYSTIIIQDNGCGIKKEELDKIFDRYNSFSNSGTKAVCGLGLCIAKNLIQRNNGEIIAESEVNSYTKFTIKLPNRGYENL